MILSWLAKLATHPLVVSVLVPSLTKALENFFERAAGRCERRSAVTQAKAAKTAEELREASRRLSDSTARR